MNRSPAMLTDWILIRRAAAEADAEAPVVEEPGVGHPGTAQLALELGRRPADEDPVRDHSRVRFTEGFKRSPKNPSWLPTCEEE